MLTLHSSNSPSFSRAMHIRRLENRVKEYAILKKYSFDSHHLRRLYDVVATGFDLMSSECLTALVTAYLESDLCLEDFEYYMKLPCSKLVHNNDPGMPKRYICNVRHWLLNDLMQGKQSVGSVIDTEVCSMVKLGEIIWRSWESEVLSHVCRVIRKMERAGIPQEIVRQVLSMVT